MTNDLFFGSEGEDEFDFQAGRPAGVTSLRLITRCDSGVV
jgi:hypothetical protein